MYGVATQNGVGVSLGNIPALTSLAYPQMLNAIVLGAFSSGAPGWLYDDSNMSTLFQDAAGTTPVTALEQPVGLQLDLSGRGNHRYQPTSANRPTWSAQYNLLTKTEDFSNAVWVKLGSSVTGTNFIVESAATTIHGVYQTVTNAASTDYVSRVDLAPSTRRYAIVTWSSANSATRWSSVVVDTQTGVITQTSNGAGGTLVSSSIAATSDGWYTLTLRASIGVSVDGILQVAGSDSDTPTVGNYGFYTYTGDGVKGIYCRKADVRPSDQATGLIPTYQRVNTATDYDANGFPAGLRWNGSNSWMQNASVDFSGTNKVSVFVGVRKASTSEGMLTELTASAGASNGTLYIDSLTNYYQVYSKGTAGVISATPTSYPSPITNTLAFFGNIGAPSNTININGVQAVTQTGSQGTGNYGNHPAYFGARGGTSIFFNGLTFSNVCIGIELSASQIAAFESWTNSRARAY